MIHIFSLASHFLTAFQIRYIEYWLMIHIFSLASYFLTAFQITYIEYWLMIHISSFASHFLTAFQIKFIEYWLLIHISSLAAHFLAAFQITSHPQTKLWVVGKPLGFWCSPLHNPTACHTLTAADHSNEREEGALEVWSFSIQGQSSY